jgi:hypothetical protein
MENVLLFLSSTTSFPWNLEIPEFFWLIRLKRTSSKIKRISHARPEAGLESRSKARGRGLVFISTEPVVMNNKLHARGGNYNE